MFEGVDQVDWTQLGPDPRLAEIPQLFIHLQSSKSSARRFAVDRFYDLFVARDGAEAGKACVPFLVEAMMSDAIVDREDLAVLLADLTAGGVHPDLLKVGRLPLPPADESAPLRAVIAEYADGFTPLLEAKKSVVRSSAALPLALFGYGERLAEALENESNKTARAALLFGVAVSAVARAETLSEAHHAIVRGGLHAEDDPTRFAAACGIQLASAQLEPQAIEILSTAILDGLSVPASFPWCGGNVEGMALVILTAACIRCENTAPLEQVFANGSDSKLAAAMVRAAFDERMDRLRRPAEISRGQLGVLRVTLLSNTYAGALAGALEAHGLPCHKESLARLAGSTAPGPLDALDVAGVPLWLRLHDALHGTGDLSALDEHISSSAEIRPLVADALGGYMVLHLGFPRPPPGSPLEVALGTQRLASLCVSMLERHADPAVLEQWLEDLRGDPAQYSRAECAVVLHAWVEKADPTRTKLLEYKPVFERAVREGLHPLLRRVLERLDTISRQDFITGVEPFIVFDRRSGSHVYEGCVPFLDLVPTAQSAQTVIGLLRTHHRPPVDRLVTVLRAIGEPARPHIDAALADDELPAHARVALESV